jgi:hypothetical protein
MWRTGRFSLVPHTTNSPFAPVVVQRLQQTLGGKIRHSEILVAAASAALKLEMRMV